MGTVIIKSDRITLAEHTADPAAVASGDFWYRADLDTLYLAIDSIVANSKRLAFPPFDTADIADLAITTAKLADLAVTSGKIAGGAVGTAQLADLGVTTAKIADNAVTTAKAAFANQDLLTTSTVTFAQVNVGDLMFGYGWKISEREDGLILSKDGKPVLLLGFEGVKQL